MHLGHFKVKLVDHQQNDIPVYGEVCEVLPRGWTVGVKVGMYRMSTGGKYHLAACHFATGVQLAMGLDKAAVLHVASDTLQKFGQKEFEEWIGKRSVINTKIERSNGFDK